MGVWGTIIVIALLLAGPSQAALVPGLTTGVPITYAGNPRSYDVYVPASYTGATPYPLVLDFHGYGVGSATQPSISGLPAVADTAGFIVVFPQGYGSSGTASWNAGGCCDPALSAGLDDVGLAKAIVSDVSAQGNIDQARIYATGHSNGSMLAQRLACDAGDVFAAVAGVAAPVLFQSPAPPCTPARPMPVLHVAGIDDTVVPYLGGPTSVFPAVVVASAADNFLHWRTAGGCTSSSPDVLQTFPTGGQCETYNQCTDGVQVSLCSLHGTDALKHFFGPGYPNSEGVVIGQRLWNFVSQFTLPVVCGDGVVGGGEACDDGGTTAGDGCDGSCQIEPGCSCSGAPSVCSCMQAVPVVPTKLIVIDTIATSGKAKLVFLAKDAGISKGSGTDPAAIGAEFTVAYGSGTTTGSFVLPQGDTGWIANGSKVSKFVNRAAPAGPTGAKVSVVKPGKLAKIVSRSLGDSPLALIEAGDPAGPVRTAYCVTNAGEHLCLCSVLTDCTYKSIAGGTGAKLVCHAGVGDPACQALTP